ncbi:hypothetical protein [Arthrobacter sp. NPDC093139]|uniref:hypothetical protein n=1 Tax=Arthrobacter sp. NPDC093139 TaxID=3363945 RepID=UPI003801207A
MAEWPPPPSATSASTTTPSTTGRTVLRAPTRQLQPQPRPNCATIHTNTPIDSINETSDSVVVTSCEKSRTFEDAIISSGGWSQRHMARTIPAETI